MSEELTIVISNSTLEHIDAHSITESDLICMYESIRSSKELRYYAKAHEMAWFEVKEKFSIHPTGKFLGDVHTPVFVMEEGAFFDGRSHMAEAVENKKNVHHTD